MKKIAIIGGSYLQLPLVEKANELGIETHCFAWENENSICKNFSSFFYPISIIEKELILSKCREIGINGIVSIASDVAVPTVSYIAEKLNLFGNSVHVSNICTNKFLMRKVLLNHTKMPKFEIISSIEDIDKIEKDNYPLIIKPTDRSGSRGVKRIESYDELLEAIEYSLNESFEKKVIVEEFIEGIELSVEMISQNGNHYPIIITDKITTGPPYFVELEHHQPSELSSDIQQKLFEETSKLLTILGIQNGASHSEYKVTSNKEIFLIEIGPRMGGDHIGAELVFLSTGFDFVKGVIDCSLGNKLNVNINGYEKTGIYFLCKETEYLQSIFEDHVKESFVYKQDKIKESLVNVQKSEDRSGYIICKGEDYKTFLKEIKNEN